MLSLKERLNEILIKNKLLSPEQLNHALEVQKTKGGKLSEIIIGLKFVAQKDLVLSLSQGLGLPLIDLKRFKIEPEVVRLIPAEVARHYQILPLSKMGDTITLAMADPLNIFAIDDVETLTSFRINPIIATSDEILQTIENSYPDLTGGMISDLVKEISAPEIELIKEKGEALPSDQELHLISRSSPVIKITDLILEGAVKKKASDILLEPWEKKMGLRVRIDGVLHEEEPPPKNMHASIISRIKVMAGLNIAEHRLSQDGRFKSKISGKEVDFRISVIPSSFGEKVAVRILDKSLGVLDIEKLGFSQRIVENLKKVAAFPHGMILASGPTGSGKTTTLYAILKFVDTPEKNMVTVEDPVEYELEGINQVTAQPEIGLTFALALRSILRQDPNVIMIGEIRDYETVDIAIKSALTGHLVLSTLHTTTACGAITRLINMGVEPYLINSSLICVLSQRLLRRICSHCREKYSLKKETLESLKIKSQQCLEKREFFRGNGCSRCFYTGYSGRVGIAEMFILTQSSRQLIMQKAQEHLLKNQARQEGMSTLREEGMELVFQGTTTLEEVLRLTASDEE